MAQNEYILIGGGEHARVVLDILLSQKVKVNALFDPKYSGKLFDVAQLGDYQPGLFTSSMAIIAIGNNSTRKKVVSSVSHAFGKVIHTTAQVSQFADAGEGTVLFHHTIVQANTKIGKHVIVNTAAQIDHDCTVGNFVHIAPGAILCGSVDVGEGTLIGAGAIIIPGIKIGKWVTVGAGAVITQAVPDGSTAVGVPGKIIKPAL